MRSPPIVRIVTEIIANYSMSLRRLCRGGGGRSASPAKMCSVRPVLVLFWAIERSYRLYLEHVCNPSPDSYTSLSYKQLNKCHTFSIIQHLHGTRYCWRHYQSYISFVALMFSKSALVVHDLGCLFRLNVYILPFIYIISLLYPSCQ